MIHPESVHDIMANSGVKKSIMSRSSVGKMDELSAMKIEAIPLTNGECMNLNIMEFLAGL